MEGKFFNFKIVYLFILVCATLKLSHAYNAIYDLNHFCEKQPSFHVNISPSKPATFRLNATDSSPSVRSDKKSSHYVFSCMFSVKPKQYGSNTSLDIEWRNLGNGCPNYIQIIKPDEKLVVYLEESGSHFVLLTGVPVVDIYVSICKLQASDRFLEISVSTTSPKPDNPTDISSIVLAFMAPFAFILLAVILAVMGSCCCSRTCSRAATQSVDLVTSCPQSETGLTSTASQPSGSRDTLFTVTSVVDKPPAYDELFPHGFAYNESALDKLHNNLSRSRSCSSGSHLEGTERRPEEPVQSGSSRSEQNLAQFTSNQDEDNHITAAQTEDTVLSGLNSNEQIVVV